MTVPTTEPTKSEKAVLRFLSHFFREHGYPPTQQEIMAATDIGSEYSVARRLDALEAKGYIARERGIARGIKILEPLSGWERIIQVPLVGILAPDYSIPVFDEMSPPSYGTVFSVTRSLLTRQQSKLDIAAESDLFALQTRDFSFTDALLGPNDLVILSQHAEVRSGDVAAVWLKERQETRVARLYRYGDTIRLQPLRVDSAPLAIEESHVNIQGKALLVVRSLSGVGPFDTSEFGFSSPIQAFARILGHLPGESLRLNDAYTLEVGLAPQLTISTDRAAAPFACSQIDAVVRAEGVDVLPDWIQPVSHIRGNLTTATFGLCPRTVGHIQIHIDLYYRRHWLQALPIRLTVDA